MTDTLEAARKKQAELGKLIREADRLSGGQPSELERDRQRKEDQRRAERRVEIPRCADPDRRAELEADDFKWLLHYRSDLFWYEFVDQQQAMIEALREAIEHGGDQSIAASRGEGKTKIFENMLLKYILSGRIPCAVLFAATATLASECLESIRDVCSRRGYQARDGALPGERLAADYPEVCVPVYALEGVTSKAGKMRASGFRFDNGERFEDVLIGFKWAGSELHFPDVPGSKAKRAAIAIRGLDSAVRGLHLSGHRPSIVCIDDPETEDSARSEEQAKKLEDRIDKGIAGLGGQQRGVARVMLTTIQNRICASYRFTDPSQKPTWRPRRFRFLVKKPDRQDLWEEYAAKREEDLQQVDEKGNYTDPNARRSHKFYVDDRESMDAGAIIANPHRFDDTVLPDGSQNEVSALQRYYNEIVRMGAVAVACELDNDPPEEAGPMESGITAYRVRNQISGYRRGIVPPGCEKLVQAIDIGKYRSYWVVKAFRIDCTAYVVNWGVLEVAHDDPGSDEAMDKVILRSLYERRDEMIREPLRTVDGQPVEIDLTLIDARFRTDVICHFCKEAGLKWKPAMGHGTSGGCVQTRFVPPTRRTTDKRPGDGWFEKRRPKRQGWMVHMDTDRWKAWEHDRWMTPPGSPGTCLLAGERWPKTRLKSKDAKREDQQRMSFAAHITNEVEREFEGVREWYTKSHTHHWLDASYMADVAANMCGITLLKSNIPEQTVPAGGWFAAQGAK